MQAADTIIEQSQQIGNYIKSKKYIVINDIYNFYVGESGAQQQDPQMLPTAEDTSKGYSCYSP